MHRREHRRTRQWLRVRMEPGTIQTVTGNLGPGGVFVHSDYLLEPGTVVQPEVELPDGTAEAEGVVRGAKKAAASPLDVVGGRGFGVQFTRVSDELRSYLDTQRRILLRAV